ncbi:MAG: hypothetical protein H6632_12655 [Anaerolineales bacterium]|nr:hypothetical protein [Anaerolineales bacterium]
MTFNMLLFTTATIILIIVSILLAYSLVRAYWRLARRQENRDQPRSGLILETVWTLMPLGLLAVLLILTFQAI